MYECARLQEADGELNQLLREIKTGKSSLQLRKLQLPNSGISVYSSIHSIADEKNDIRRAAWFGPFWQVTVKLVTERFVWPSINKDMQNISQQQSSLQQL